jgi:hypothetical protein
MLNSEDYMKRKLADILFSASLSFKLPAEANTAIRSVAFLIRDLADEDHAASLTDKIIDRLSTWLNEPMSLISNEVNNAKQFLSVTTTQQAEATIALQKAVDNFSSNVDKLTQASDKATELIDKHQQQLSAADWLRLGGGSATLLASRNPLNPSVFSLSPAKAKMQHRVLLAAKQIYVTIDPNNEDAPSSCTIEAQRKPRDDLTRWLAEDARVKNPDYNNPQAMISLLSPWTHNRPSSCFSRLSNDIRNTARLCDLALTSCLRQEPRHTICRAASCSASHAVTHHTFCPVADYRPDNHGSSSRQHFTIYGI